MSKTLVHEMKHEGFTHVFPRMIPWLKSRDINESVEKGEERNQQAQVGWKQLFKTYTT